MQPEPKYAAERLYALASALLCLEHTAGAALDPVALGAAVDAVLVAAVRAELALRGLAAAYPAHHDDLVRLSALVRAGAISPDAAARAAGWVGSL